MDNISEKDKKLIAEAKQVTNPIDWGIVAQLLDKAETDEAKNALHEIMVHLYHLEERICDCL